MDYKLDKSANDQVYTYGSVEWLIALAKSPDRERVIKLVTELHSCRESLCLDAANILKAKLGFRYDHGAKRLLTLNDRRYTNIVVFSKLYSHPSRGGLHKNHDNLAKTREGLIQKAVFVINSLERNVGWPLTKIRRITENHNGQEFHPADLFYYIRGSSKWLRAPSLLSLYGILLRSGALTPVKSKDIKSSDEKVFLCLQAEVRKTKRPTGTYLRAALGYGIPFLQKVDSLFKGRTIPFNYGIDRLRNGKSEIGIEGFHKLISGSTRDDQLNERVREHIFGEVKLEKEPQRMKAGG